MTGQATVVGVVQMTSTPDVERNLGTMERLVEEGTERRATLLVLPENFAYLGPDAGRLKIAEPLPDGGPILRRCAALAKREQCELILGGFPERGGATGKTRNACVHLGADGSVRAVYRKIHLFDVALDDGTTITESATMEPGEDVVVSEAAFGGLGLSVCYDVRFPELYRRLVDQGAVVLAIPSAFTETTGQAHWHILVRARAIESQAYVLAAAQVGRHFEHRSSYGHALIIDPWGEVLAECLEPAQVVVARVDPAVVSDVRRQLPSLRHRRL